MPAGAASLAVDDHLAETRRQRIGIVLLFLAGLFWSLNGVLIKLVYDEGRGPGGVTIAFYRSLFAGLFLIPLAWRGFRTLRRPQRAQSQAQPLLSLRPAAWSCVLYFTLMTVCFVVANTRTEALNAIILQYTSTFWVFGLSPWILKERAAGRDIWILVLAIIGVGMIFGGGASGDLFGLMNALGAGLFFALLTLMIRRMKDANSAAVTTLNNLGSALLILPFAALVDGLGLSARSLFLLVLLGVIQFGLPYYLYTLGLARVQAYRASLITMVEPVLVPVWTFLVIGEVPPTWNLAGAGVIFLALLIFLISAGRAPPALARIAESPVRANEPKEHR